MILQISSGKGPVECRVAVGGICSFFHVVWNDKELRRRAYKQSQCQDLRKIRLQVPKKH